MTRKSQPKPRDRYAETRATTQARRLRAAFRCKLAEERREIAPAEFYTNDLETVRRLGSGRTLPKVSS